MNVPHCFKIVKRSGKACMQYKYFSNSQDPYMPKMPSQICIPLPHMWKNESITIPPSDPSKLHFLRNLFFILRKIVFVRSDYLYVKGGSKVWLKSQGIESMDDLINDAEKKEVWDRFAFVQLSFFYFK